MSLPRAFILLVLLFAVLALPGQADRPASSGYRKPPEAIRKILDLPGTPAATLSPRRDYLVLASSERYPGIADLARPVLRLAGLRIDPSTNGPQHAPRVTALTLVPLAGGKPISLELPPGGRPDMPLWSPDGKRFAVLVTTATGIQLWLGSPSSTRLQRVEGLAINDVYGEALHWLPDGTTLLCQAIPRGRGPAPARPARPEGPTIQESSGKPAPVRTYQDLLKNEHDEALFDHYGTAQLTLLDVTTGKMTPIGKPGLFALVEPSPDGKHLLVTRTHRPYSYVLPAFAFAKTVEVWDRTGKVEHKLAELPAAENVPIEGVPTGPRNVAWRPDVPATLTWATALDGGDPRKKVAHRDRISSLSAPFKGGARELAKTQHRYAGLSWGEKGVALLTEFDRETRRVRTSRIDPDGSDKKGQVVWDRNLQDRYGDPGTPLLRRLPSGHRAMIQDGDALFLSGAGASPQGNRPFLDRFDLKTRKATRLFGSAGDCYESVVALLSDDGKEFMTRHESPTSPPNYRIRTAGKEGFRAVTNFEDLAPELRKITRRLVRYKRPDGVPLSFTLYLPPGYKEGTRLPTVVWAYPREYTDPAVAGQVFGSTSRYTTLAGTSHLFFLLAGYAVLDDAAMPVVGSPEKANDTFVEQIVASAKAAIDKAAELGVTDPERVGVGGHSYGAFMTANLLAHSDLFRAGIARSGAYNRTLTPFGFQSERRTLWQAPEIYAKMSPFMSANKINEPILLIHGEADNNAGTFPMQSERLYQAIRGNGGTVRYVSLPHESHGYAARESVEHVLYEMLGWFDRHVKEPGKKR